MGKQFYASIVNIVSCFVVALPLGIYCAFNLGYGLQGLWIGMIANVVLQSSIYQVVIFTSNWNIIADKAKDSLKEADVSMTSVDMGPQ
jgi:MATE family multidrug resistance protein